MHHITNWSSQYVSFHLLPSKEILDERRVYVYGAVSPMVVAQEAILLVAGWTEFFPGTCFPRSIDAEGKETSHSNEDFLSQRVIFAREREKTVDNFIKNSPLIFSCCCCIFCLTVLIFANEHSTVFLLMDHHSMPRHVARHNERMRAGLTKRRMKTDVASPTDRPFLLSLSEKTHSSFNYFLSFWVHWEISS